MASAESKIGKLEEEALKRKEKLRNLKRKREKSSSDTHESKEANQSEALPEPKFRSYKPANKELESFVAEPITPGDVGAEIRDQLESAKSEMVIEQLDVTSLAPRKPDWDLKRDVAKKMEKLERQTQKAIAELIRERLKERKKNEDLAAIVNVGAAES